MPVDIRDADRREVVVFQAQLDLLAGAERSLIALASWLHRQGLAVRLVTYKDTCRFAQYADFVLPVDDLSVGSGTMARVTALRKYFLARGKSALLPLVSGYQSTLHSTMARIGGFHCLMHDTPALFAMDRPDGLAKWTQRARVAASNRLIGAGMRRGGTMVVTSEFLQRDSLEQFGIEAEVARMGGMFHAEGFRLREIKNELRMLSVCRIESNKRIDWILEALAELEGESRPLSSRVDWRFDLAGAGSLLETMRGRAEDLGLGSRVHFRGFVSDEELKALYERAHLFLMPAVQGYGIPAIEALQRGIPVLLHRDSGVSDILLDTPLASVLAGGQEELKPRLEAMIQLLLANGHINVGPTIDLPTEDSWAERVAKLCRYV